MWFLLIFIAIETPSRSYTFMRVRFAKIDSFSERFFTLSIGSTRWTKVVRLCADKIKRKKLLLFQRFIYCCFRDMVRASYSAVVVSGVILTHRITMLITDKSEERTLLWFKGYNSLMDWSICTLMSRLPPQVDITAFVIFPSNDEL